MRGSKEVLIASADSVRLSPRWRIIRSVLSLLVVMATVASLVIPAFGDRSKTFCGMEEDPQHVHSLQCYADTNADIEDEATWLPSLAAAELTGSAADDLLSVARTQLGYRESSKNYIVDAENGIHGWNRYGARLGEAYMDWNAAFIGFCLYYAGIDFAPDGGDLTSYAEWIADEARSSEAAAPSVGAVLLLDLDENGEGDTLGILAKSTERSVTAIVGDSNNAVEYVTLAALSKALLAYRNLPSSAEQPEETEPTQAPESKLTPEPTKEPENKVTPEPTKEPENKVTPEPAPDPEIKTTPEPAQQSKYDTELTATAEDGTVVTLTFSAKENVFGVPADELELTAAKIEDAAALALLKQALAGDKIGAEAALSVLLLDVKVLHHGRQVQPEDGKSVLVKLEGEAVIKSAAVYGIDVEAGTAQIMGVLRDTNEAFCFAAEKLTVFGVTGYGQTEPTRGKRIMIMSDGDKSQGTGLQYYIWDPATTGNVLPITTVGFVAGSGWPTTPVNRVTWKLDTYAYAFVDSYFYVNANNYIRANWDVEYESNFGSTSEWYSNHRLEFNSFPPMNIFIAVRIMYNGGSYDGNELYLTTIDNSIANCASGDNFGRIIQMTTAGYSNDFQMPQIVSVTGPDASKVTCSIITKAQLQQKVDDISAYNDYSQIYILYIEPKTRIPLETDFYYNLEIKIRIPNRFVDQYGIKHDMVLDFVYVRGWLLDVYASDGYTGRGFAPIAFTPNEIIQANVYILRNNNMTANEKGIRGPGVFRFGCICTSDGFSDTDKAVLFYHDTDSEHNRLGGAVSWFQNALNRFYNTRSNDTRWLYEWYNFANLSKNASDWNYWYAVSDISSIRTVATDPGTATTKVRGFYSAGSTEAGKINDFYAVVTPKNTAFEINTMNARRTTFGRAVNTIGIRVAYKTYNSNGTLSGWKIYAGNNNMGGLPNGKVRFVDQTPGLRTLNAADNTATLTTMPANSDGGYLRRYASLGKTIKASWDVIPGWYYIGQRTIGNNTVNVNSGDTITTTADTYYTVNYQPVTGTFRFRKVDDRGNAITTGAEFTMTGTSAYHGSFTLKSVHTGNGWYEIRNVPMGTSANTYTVTETKIPSGHDACTPFTVTGDKFSTNGATVNYAGGNVVDYRVSYTLTLKKVVANGNTVNNNENFTFTYSINGGAAQTVTLKHNGTKAISVRNGDSVVITESAQTGYTLTAISGGTVDLTNRKTTVSVTGNSTVTFTNTPNSYTLTLKKLVANGSAEDNNIGFPFDYEINGGTKQRVTLKHEDTVDIPVRYGDSVVITEGRYPGFALTAISGGTVDLTNRKTTVSVTDNSEVMFTNTPSPYDVEIHKASNPASGTGQAPATVQPGQEIVYQISLKNNSDWEMADYVIEDTLPSWVTVSDEQKARISLEPLGTYIPYPGWVDDVDWSGNKVTITGVRLDHAGGPASEITISIPCTVRTDVPPGTVITNQAKLTRLDYETVDELSETTYHKTPEHINLKITKNVVDAEPAQMDDVFSFKLKVKNADGTEFDATTLTLPSGALGYANGEITFGLMHSGSILIEGLPIGAKVTLNETGHDGYYVCMEITGLSGTVPGASSGELTLTQNCEITVHNATGVEMPNTGGSGTLLLTLGGLLLMTTAFTCCVFIIRRRRAAGIG